MNLVDNTDDEWKGSLARQKVMMCNFHWNLSLGSHHWHCCTHMLYWQGNPLQWALCMSRKKLKSWQMWKAVRWNEPYFNVRWGTVCLFSNRVCRLSRHLCELFKSLLILLNSIMSVCLACKFVEIWLRPVCPAGTGARSLVLATFIPKRDLKSTHTCLPSSVSGQNNIVYSPCMEET